jgi:hypothetical protein
MSVTGVVVTFTIVMSCENSLLILRLSGILTLTGDGIQIAIDP